MTIVLNYLLHLLLFLLLQFPHGRSCSLLCSSRSRFLVINFSSLNEHGGASLNISLSELGLLADYVLLHVLAGSRGFCFLALHGHKPSFRRTEDSCLTRELAIHTVGELFLLVLARTWNNFSICSDKASSILIESISHGYETYIFTIPQLVGNDRT